MTDKKIEEQIETIFWKGYCDSQSCCVHEFDADSTNLVRVYPEIMEKLKEVINTEVQKAREEAVKGFVESISKQGITVYVEAPKFVEALENEAETYLQSLDKGDRE